MMWAWSGANIADSESQVLAALPSVQRGFLKVKVNVYSAQQCSVVKRLHVWFQKG